MQFLFMPFGQEQIWFGVVIIVIGSTQDNGSGMRFAYRAADP